MNFDGNRFCIENGHLTWDYTGLVEYEGSWFYVKSNLLDWCYNGAAEYDGVECEVVNGIVEL